MHPPQHTVLKICTKDLELVNVKISYQDKHTGKTGFYSAGLRNPTVAKRKKIQLQQNGKLHAMEVCITIPVKHQVSQRQTSSAATLDTQPRPRPSTQPLHSIPNRVPPASATQLSADSCASPHYAPSPATIPQSSDTGHSPLQQQSPFPMGSFPPSRVAG